MTAEDLAKAICKADGKNPEKIYKKKPLYEYSLSYASDILANLPTPVPKPKSKAPTISFDEKLKVGVQAYINAFNQLADDPYISVAEMRPNQLNLHMSSLRAAITEMLKE